MLDELEDDDSVPPYIEVDKGAPLWLNLVYIFVPIWGIVVFFLYWNGSYGWLDRGYWEQLQKAANTTFPAKELPKVDVDK
ncbi:MAG: hypothetical protein K940chlam3_01301 [Chlamydiae bacterium]|nr:hypothetical protein [Chlamydiota bacterium]